MCLIAWHWQPGSAVPLLLVANRDEYYARPALALHWWEDEKVLAGRDMQAGGTWLGTSRDGRVAALTNFRLAQLDPRPRPSRGDLVADFLRGEMDASSYLDALSQKADAYNPFNLLVFDGKNLMGLESRHRKVLTFQPGIGGVSNSDFDTPWPKLMRLKTALLDQCIARRVTVDDLLPLLQNKILASDQDLPKTGITLDQERMLSACWIHSPHYGTRASSILCVSEKHVSFFEQGYDEQGLLGASRHTFAPACN